MPISTQISVSARPVIAILVFIDLYTPRTCALQSAPPTKVLNSVPCAGFELASSGIFIPSEPPYSNTDLLVAVNQAVLRSVSGCHADQALARFSPLNSRLLGSMLDPYRSPGLPGTGRCSYEELTSLPVNFRSYLYNGSES